MGCKAAVLAWAWVFLTILPLLACIGIAHWFRHDYRALHEQDRKEGTCNGTD
jgi:hypothetical protein